MSRATGPHSGLLGYVGLRGIVGLRWIVALVLLAGLSFGGAVATDNWERRALSGMVTARAQVERFGGDETYLMVWNDQIFAHLVRIPDGLLASSGDGARVKVYYSPVTHQVILKSRREDAPVLLGTLGLACLATAAVLLHRRRRDAFEMVDSPNG